LSDGNNAFYIQLKKQFLRIQTLFVFNIPGGGIKFETRTVGFDYSGVFFVVMKTRYDYELSIDSVYFFSASLSVFSAVSVRRTALVFD